MYLLIYLILIVLAQLIFIYNKILFKNFEKYFEKFHVNFSISEVIEYKRNQTTILGELLKNIINLLEKQDKNSLYFSNYFNYKYHYTSLENFRKKELL
jgi:hypothetical protein